jgi:cellulose synthase (UDP-forming)
MQEVEYPTVDVFLPRLGYKEDWTLYGPTVHAALALGYPKDKFVVHVLGDGCRLEPILPHLEDLMQQHPNLRCVTRPDGKDGKAGNLNHALHSSRSTNTLVVVFDADHSCKPDFLLRTIPHLLSVVNGRRLPTLSDHTAFVQTTQAFCNEHLPLMRLLDGSQALFYRLLMPSFNGMDCAFCVGTGYVMHRAALNSIGGYVRDCVVEDITTSFALHKRGWASEYLDCRLSEGLSPSTPSEFYAQRERWVAGSAQLLFYSGMSTTSGIPFRYRLAYLTGSWYWLSAIVFLFLVLVRITLSLIYSSMSGVKTTTWIPVLSEYFPVYIIFLLMPVLSLPAKIACVFTIFSFVPTYLSVFCNLVAGRLNPIRRGAFRVLTSYEAFGDAWPRLANLNVAILVVASLSFGLSTISVFRVSKAPLDWVASGSFVGWLYLVNAPIIYGVYRRAFRFCSLAHQRFHSHSKQ